MITKKIMNEEILKGLVPKFDANKHVPHENYYWWSWHPRYPYWSKSCWGGDTEAEAMKVWEFYARGGLAVYHNKLIKEYKGEFTEILDVPCTRLDVWQKCIEIDNNLEKLQTLAY